MQNVFRWIILFSIANLFSFIQLVKAYGAENLSFEESIEDYKKYKKLLSSRTLDDRKISFLDLNSQEENSVLFLHGVPTNSWMYRNVVRELKQEPLRLVAVDLLGFGQSDKPRKDDEYKLENRADRIIALIQLLGLRNITLVFHDMGGGVAWEILKKRPDLISNLLVLNTFLYKEHWKHGQKGLGGFFSRSFMRMFMFSFSDWFSKTFISGAVLDKDSLSKSDRQGYTIPLKRKGRFPYFSFLKRVPKIENKLPEYQNAYRAFSGPISILWGQKDNWLKSDGHREKLVLDNKNVFEHYVFEDSKHLIAEEKPKEIATAIKALVDHGLSLKHNIQLEEE